MMRNTIYRNLDAEMSRQKITNEDIAKILNKNISTITAKLNVPDRIKLSECLKIKNEFFPTLEIDYLFSTDTTT